MSTPNMLTLLRVLMVPLFMWALNTGLYAVAIIIFILASLTDQLDGFLARKNNQVTTFGKLQYAVHRHGVVEPVGPGGRVDDHLAALMNDLAFVEPRPVLQLHGIAPFRDYPVDYSSIFTWPVSPFPGAVRPI